MFVIICRHEASLRVQSKRLFFQFQTCLCWTVFSESTTSYGNNSKRQYSLTFFLSRGVLSSHCQILSGCERELWECSLFPLSEQLEASHVNCITGTGIDVKVTCVSQMTPLIPLSCLNQTHTSPEENGLVGDMNCTVLGS